MARTITPDATVAPLDGGRILVREGDAVEVIRPPRGAVRLYRTGKATSLVFGTPTKSQLVFNGERSQLEHVFIVLTGVTP